MKEQMLKKREKCPITYPFRNRALGLFTVLLIVSCFRIHAENLAEKNIALEYVATQTNEVTGTIVDEDNNPLPGASVVVKGTTKGTVADFDGNFSISVTDGTAVLVISYVGYKTTEIPSSVGSTYESTARA